jgi:hypothetical protein
MKQRFLMWGLASIAFAVTLAISSWQQGLWPASEDTPKRGNRATALVSADPPPMPAQPFGPSHPGPVVVAEATPPAPQALQPPETPVAEAEPPPPMPTAEAEVDTEQLLSHRDRAAQHSSRAR